MSEVLGRNRPGANGGNEARLSGGNDRHEAKWCCSGIERTVYCASRCDCNCSWKQRYTSRVLALEVETLSGKNDPGVLSRGMEVQFDSLPRLNMPTDDSGIWILGNDDSRRFICTGLEVRM